MSERKVLNKYIPPDFDPSKLERSGPQRRSKSQGKSRQLQTVRLTTPFLMRCNTCGEYIHTGKKFNARKELSGEFYLGKIQIIRFYIRCPQCAAELCFRTDPETAFYQVHSGAHRPFKSSGHRLTDVQDNIDADKKREEEMTAMERIERQSAAHNAEQEMKQELEDMLEYNTKLELQSVNLRDELVSSKRSSKENNSEEEEMERLADEAFHWDDQKRIVRTAIPNLKDQEECRGSDYMEQFKVHKLKRRQKKSLKL